MRNPGLNTRIRLLPWVIGCIAWPLHADQSAPLQVAPELLVGPDATEVRAQRIYGTRQFELVADGDAELRREGLQVNADRLTYRELLDEVEAEGNVRIERDGDVISGPRARMVMHERVGEMTSPTYVLRGPQSRTDGESRDLPGGRGQAEALYFEGENQYRLRGATWTTCEAPDPDWYVKADDLALDYDREVGVARGGSLVFKDTTLLWWPWADFPLGSNRQSGLLPPTMGLSNKTGVDVSIPYYWNIAPNYDATIAPRIMTRRGVQIGGEFRYLMPDYRGEARAEWMPRDNVTGESRSLGALQHQHRLGANLFASLDLNAVSDDRYFEDLSSRVEGASRTNLLREGRLFYNGGGWWTASAMVQSYQTLADAESPYRRVPQLRLDARRAEGLGGAVFAFEGEYVKFDHPDSDQATGSRLLAYPQVSFPYEQAGYFVTPKLGFHHTRYDIDRNVVGGRSDITRSMPVLTIDSGVFFERDTALFGNAYRQTLEPRLMYVRVPYREQADIPIFDTARYDFGFAQIFSENRYSGADRIADANQLTAAVTTRYIEPASGIERLRATIGQRYYFDDRRVLLPDERDSGSNKTDLLAALSGRITTTVSLDSALQYNMRDNLTERLNLSVRYQPDHAKVLNLGYRFSRDVLRDLDVSAQWPLGGRWYGVTRVSRSIKEKRITEAIGGLEYDGGCWVFRTALHRFATNPDKTTNAVFFQLELSGLGSLGPSPVNLLRRSVPGYGKINDSLSDRYFGAE
ncbi:MAG: LPS-assembly protein LptD [Rhodocyclaceae bacterium]